MNKNTKTERNAEIVRLYKTGLFSSCEIAERMGISRQRVNQILQGHGIFVNEIYALRRKQKKEIYNHPKFYGMTNLAVAKTMKVSNSTISKYRKPTHIADRFWDFVDRPDDDDCWLWVGQTTRAGYGCFRKNDKTAYVHRVAWEEYNGKIPDDQYLCHKCNNKNCCNPKHLYLSYKKHGKKVNIEIRNF